ncbi:MAG: adenosylcobinamide amidohydrolase [Pelosinus sp.]|nr:adenosylcobinamide amidohydrolase [Pelosinus sp.]
MDKRTLKTGGVFTIDNQFIICKFSSLRTVLSTSSYNGGFLLADAVFNHRPTFAVKNEQDLPGGSIAGYLALTSEKQGLKRSTGLLTTARMHCYSYSNAAYKNIIVETIATAAIDKNAIRAGNSASYYEMQGQYHGVGDTINIFVLTNVSLPQGAMVKALLTITEAKTAALQELCVINSQTHTPATGTSTDGVILAADPEADITCTNTRTQTKLGELIGKTVKQAVKNSLARANGLTPGVQAALVNRAQRLDASLSTDKEGMPERLLLAMCQSVWQEYAWQLLSQNELHLFCTWLEKTPHQPLGKDIAAVFRQRLKSTSR